MNNTIYIADTCTLRKANAREALHKALHADADRRLLILASVRAELERQATEQNEPDTIAEATAALNFLREEYTHIIHEPQSDGYPDNCNADNEILYYCFTHKKDKIVLYTQDGDLSQAALHLCSHVKVLKSASTYFVTIPETFKQQYEDLLAPYSRVFCTAEAANLAAENGVDRFLFPCDKVAISKLSLCKLTLNAHESTSEYEKHITWFSPSAECDISETDELTIRLLTHCYRNKMVLLLLAEDEDSTPYLNSGQFLSCSRNRGFAIAVLSKDGNVSLLSPSPKQPKEESLTPPQKDEAKEQAPKQKAQANEISAEDAEDMNAVKQFIEDSKIGKAHKLMEKSDELLWRGINYCQRNIKRTQQLYNLIELVKASGKKVPSACFIAYVFNILNQKAKKEEHLQKRLEHDVTSKSIQKIIEISEVPLRKHEAAIEKLKELQHENGAAVGKLIQKILDSVSSHNSTAQKK